MRLSRGVGQPSAKDTPPNDGGSSVPFLVQAFVNANTVLVGC
jgi:hypothetical protein